MTKLEDIEKLIEALKPEDYAKFRDWFEDLDARVFDKKIEADAKSGRLDKAFEADFEEYKAGRARDL